jgi:hypothetical protein
MSAHTIEQLFEEFALSYRRGESPDVPAYLARARSEEEREALGALIDRFLQAVPAQPPTDEEVVLMEARLSGDPPLLVLRRHRKLTRDAVVDALVKTLALARDKRDKVARYYHELETGLLDPTPVDRRVWEVLAQTLRANVESLARRWPTPPVVHTYLRPADFSLEAHEPAPSQDVGEPAERDEVDALFTGSR